MKSFIVCALCIVSAIAEPPVDNRYLPPQQGYRTTSQDNFAPPSQSHGQFGPQRQTDALFSNRPSSSYGTPRSPSNQYGPPNRRQMQRPSNQYGPPSQSSRQNQISNQYGPPSKPTKLGQNQPSNQYGPPSQSARQHEQPSNQYGPPNFNNRNPESSIDYASQQPGLQSQQFNAPSQQYGAPSQQYGTPNRNGFGSPSQSYGAPDNQYLPPNRRNGYDSDSDGSSEPANYSFEYMVKDDDSGNDFGHRESRQGDRAEGLYYVLLPDGRKQTVEYEADQAGYKPKISYEDTGLGRGYDRNSQDSGSQGYQGQSGPY